MKLTYVKKIFRKIKHHAIYVCSISFKVQEWFQRADKFYNLCQSVMNLAKKIATCANKELCYDLYSYVWDMAGVITLLCAFIKWLGKNLNLCFIWKSSHVSHLFLLALGYFPANINSYTQGNYTCRWRVYSIYSPKNCPNIINHSIYCQNRVQQRLEGNIFIRRTGAMGFSWRIISWFAKTYTDWFGQWFVYLQTTWFTDTTFLHNSTVFAHGRTWSILYMS